MPAPEIRKVLLGLPWQIEKDSSTLYQFFQRFSGAPLARPGPEAGEPSHPLRACRTLTIGPDQVSSCFHGSGAIADCL